MRFEHTCIHLFYITSNEGGLLRGGFSTILFIIIVTIILGVILAVTLLKNNQNEEYIQKTKCFVFAFAKYKNAAYLLNQHMELANDRNVYGAFFAKVLSIKYVH